MQNAVMDEATTRAMPSVLIAEHEALLRWVIRETVCNRFRVLEADTADAVERTLAEADNGLALVMIELRLAGGSALELLRHVKQINPSCHAIVMSGAAEALLDAEVRGLGATLLPKPFDVADLNAVIDRVPPQV